MWILSQDKKYLVKVNGLFIYHHVDTGITEIKDYDSGQVLAKYIGNTKALKVLGVIEKELNKQLEFKAQGERKGMGNQRLMKWVFELPQDSEVE